MPEPNIIHQETDTHGPLMVRDDGSYRTLAFAQNDEQSRCLKAAPHIPQYEYTQAMLLVLLFCEPKRVLILGLGGGSLLTTLHHHLPGLHITAVELRSAVIDLAYRFFQLPRSKRLQVLCQDADDFLRDNDQRKYDVIFTDLYHGDGVDQAQLRASYIDRCAAQLKNNGWLVINAWTEHREDTAFIDALRTQFTDVRTVLTDSRNWVILAGKVADTQSARVLKDAALDWSNRFDASLSRHLARLRALGE